MSGKSQIKPHHRTTGQEGEVPSQAGFTLMELLIAATLSVFLLMAASTLFMTFLTGNAATNTRLHLKGEGTNAMRQMEFFVRNSIKLAACSSSQLSVVSLDGGVTTFRSEVVNGVNRIASSSATSTVHLTSPSVTVSDETGQSDLSFVCRTTATSTAVEISFSLRRVEQGSTSTFMETFKSSATMRN